MKIRLKKFKVVKSTKRYCNKANKKIKEPTLITSRKQTKGRGQIEKNGFHKQAIYLLLYFSE